MARKSKKKHHRVSKRARKAFLRNLAKARRALKGRHRRVHHKKRR